MKQALFISFIILCIFNSQGSTAQSLQECQTNGKHTPTIHGRITNNEGEPETGVKVNVTDHGCFKIFTKTDAYGIYSLNLPEGKYQITITYKTGAEHSTEDIPLRKGERLKIDFDERYFKKEKALEVVADEDDERPN